MNIAGKLNNVWVGGIIISKAIPMSGKPGCFRWKTRNDIFDPTFWNEKLSSLGHYRPKFPLTRVAGGSWLNLLSMKAAKLTQSALL